MFDTGFEFTEAGRAGVGSDEPKKSRPKRESPCFVDFSGVKALFRGGFLLPGGAVVDLGGSMGVRSSKRSIFCCCFGGSCCGAGGDVCRLSNFC